MWDKPHLLRLGAAVLFAISFVLLGWNMLQYALELHVFKLRTVQLTSAPQQIDLNQLNQVVRQAAAGSFFTVDLEKTRHLFEQLPWVRTVSVRRHFPWGLEVTLEEHVPMARWNSVALVNTHGEVFAGQSDLSLPDFNGEPDTSEQVTEMYVTLNKQLAALQRSIAQISLSPRYAWQLRLDNGMLLELGREQMQQRMKKFVAVYPYSLAKMSHKVNYVDLRYHTGFAVNQIGAVAGKIEMRVDSKQKSGNRI